MLPALILVVLAQSGNLSQPAELTGVLEPFLTAPAPTAAVFCEAATDTDRRLLPERDRKGRLWSCNVMCVAPIGKRRALLIERRWRQPVLFVDVNNDGRFAESERHAFPHEGDLHFRIPLSAAPFSEYPVAMRYDRKLFKWGGTHPERRVLLESPLAHVGGIITVAGRSHRVEYPVLPNMMPSADGGWFRIDSNGDGFIDDDPLSNESAPPSTRPAIVPVGDRYLSTLSIDPDTRIVRLREHPASDYQRIMLRAGERLPDFTYEDASGKRRALSEIRGRLVLLVVWSSWCPPAVAELPRVEVTYRKMRKDGLAVLGLPYESDHSQFEWLVSGMRLTWSQAKPESIQDLVRNRWQVSAIPLFILLDGERRILMLSRGRDMSLRGTRLGKTLQRMMKTVR